MKNLFNSKKGQVKNYLGIAVFIFVIIILFMIGYLIFSNFAEQWKSTSFSTDTTDSVLDGFEAGFLVFDKIIVVILAILIGGLMISNYRIATRPVYFWISLILGLFLGLPGYFLSYAFSKIASHEVFSSVLHAFPISTIIATNLHWVVLVAWVFGSITLYSKTEQAGL